MVGGTKLGSTPTDQSRDSPVLVLSFAEPGTKPAVLRHRSAEVSLDNAFSLIEGHRHASVASSRILVQFCRVGFRLRAGGLSTAEKAGRRAGAKKNQSPLPGNPFPSSPLPSNPLTQPVLTTPSSLPLLHPYPAVVFDGGTGFPREEPAFHTP